ncbi:MAG: hypothetical protein OXG92_14890 [Chloroflexi bacterium]|nr:hypothetical protein [Chloroflexota bacterium]MCY3583265.1 hypothetical protein [Chloroflexota bacterium]MCY3717734.1 hypothetical protein [Chloroflexota bacterium]MDE2651780.1 hypothetical protein [Chloroflexota bacterium]MXX51486.1 hypothetical protein [Chloroflexota bacterium]
MPGGRALLVCALLMLAGCGALLPAQPPAQLANTPGAPIVVSRGSIETGVFRVEYPPAWRVVKLNEAGGGLHLSFIAPDGGNVTLAQVAGDTAGEEILRLENGWGVKVTIKHSDAPSAHFSQQAQALVKSIRV